MDKDEIKQWIEGWEGCRSQLYTDNKGHLTIGIGFNLDRGDARGKIEGLGLDYDQVRAGQVTLSNEHIARLFDGDVDQAIADARGMVSNFDSIPESKKKVVVDMVFNLGATGFAGFRNMIKAIEKEDWATAAQEMKSSLWYGQVGNRAVDDVKVMGNDGESGGRTAATTASEGAVAARPELHSDIDASEGEKIAQTAEQLAQDYRRRGVQYQEGGDASTGGSYSDCSHFVHDVLMRAGFDIPYTSTGDMAASEYFGEIQQPVARAGDLIVQGHHMGIFQGKYEGGCPLGTQMGVHGPADGKWGPGGWFDDGEDMGFYRPYV